MERARSVDATPGGREAADAMEVIQAATRRKAWVDMWKTHALECRQRSWSKECLGFAFSLCCRVVRLPNAPVPTAFSVTVLFPHSAEGSAVASSGSPTVLVAYRTTTFQQKLFQIALLSAHPLIENFLHDLFSWSAMRVSSLELYLQVKNVHSDCFCYAGAYSIRNVF